jgi:o-succinylbenzoate---CoA ligase
MTEYPYSCVWINGRKVWLRDISDERADSKTEFERNTFLFIKEWLGGKTEFELQTSGSTGSPKKITVTRDMMKASAVLTARALQLQSNFNALVCLDTRYIAGKMMLVRCLEVGMKIFAVDPCANPLIKIPIDQTIHFIALVPYQVKAILDSKHPHLLDNLLICIIGGAAVEENIHNRLQRLTCNFYITYGMTETVSHIALQKIDQSDARLYETLPGITVRLDERSCLVIRVPFLPSEVVTNDVAELITENTFRWLGRIDNVINTGGIKVSPELLEEKIGQIFIRLHISNRFFVHSIPDEKLGYKVVLVIESPIDNSVRDSLHKTFLHSFSSYEMPKEIFYVDQLVMTNTAKINRQESFRKAALLPALYPQR